MIEEELYKLATEELNGPDRRPDLWKRAVALATDDHDEARYLYTNLRVEEMIEARDRNGDLEYDTSPVTKPPAPANEPASVKTHIAELGDSKIPDSELGIDELSEDLKNQIVANDSSNEEPSIDRPVFKKSGSGNLESGNLEPDTTDLESSAQDGSGHDNPDPYNTEYDDAESLLQRTALDDSLNSTGELADEDPTLKVNTLRQGDAPRVVPDFSAMGDSLDIIRIPAAEEIPSFEEASRTSAFPSAGSAHPDALQDDAIFEDDNPEIDLDERANQTQDITRQLDDTLDSTWTASLGEGAIAKTIAGGVTGNGRKRFSILSDDRGRLKAVKDGVSWPAMLVTLPWLLTKKLWGTALIYLVLLAVIVLGGIAIALHIDDAGQWTNPMRLLAVGFGILGFVGIFLLPFLCGNAWVSNKLQRKGYLSKGLLKANSPAHALDQIVG